LTRPHIVKYRIDGDVTKRIAPLAELPQDFLDEWLDLPWEEALRWADRAASPDLERVHSALHNRDGYRAQEILFVRRCAAAPNRWDIAIETTPSDRETANPDTETPETPVPKQILFSIEKRKEGFYVRSAGETPLRRISSPED
jgi:hypothetical protein